MTAARFRATDRAVGSVFAGIGLSMFYVCSQGHTLEQNRNYANSSLTQTP
jgi:hypothetical protein